VHHYWRFRDYARRVIDEMIKVEVFKERLQAVVEIMPYEEGRYVRLKIEKQ